MVSSTQPRFGPRWPPVLATLVTSASRISAASAGSCVGREGPKVFGAPERSQERHGAAVSSLRRRSGSDGRGRSTVAAHATPAGARGTPAAPGTLRAWAPTARRAAPPATTSTPRAAGGQPGALALVGGHRRLDRVRRQLVGQLHPHGAPARAGCFQPGGHVVAGEAGEQHRVAAQHLVRPVVGRARSNSHATAVRSQSGAPGGRTSSGQPGGPPHGRNGRATRSGDWRLSQNCSNPQVPAPLEW